MRRCGYTLFEVVLVMAVLLVVGAVSLPLVKPMLASNNVQAADDVVRARWTEMRTHAMKEGRAYRFAIVANTGKYRIAPDDPQFWGGSGQATTSSDAPAWVVEETLPGEVLFMNADASASQGGTSSSVGGPWTHSFTFLADGTAPQDVQVGFGQGGKASVVLKLLGKTGAIAAGEDFQQGNGT